MQQVIEKIRTALTDTDFAGKTFIAGGYVRDQIMGNDTDDIDITVELPQGGIKLAEYLHKLGIATKPVIYQEFGTALVQIDNYRIEFVMTRNESYRKGSRKPVTNSGTILEDISRRDFTINSLIMDIMTGDIKDLSGQGRNDIEKGIIRATSDPHLIFGDDPLRILRAVRFANRYQFVIDKATCEGMLKDRHELVNISWERRRDEFEKILLSKTPAEGILLIYKFKLMPYLVPELADICSDLNLDLLKVVPSKLIPRLGLLLDTTYVGEEKKELITKIISRLKFSRKTALNCIKFLDLYNILKVMLNDHEADDLALRKYIYQCRETFFELAGYLENVFRMLPDFDRLKNSCKKLYHEFEGKSYPVTGNTLKSHFNLPECREVGVYYQRGLKIWLKNPQLSANDILSKLES